MRWSRSRWCAAGGRTRRGCFTRADPTALVNRSGIEALAICLINSFANPDQHLLTMAQQAFPAPHVCASADIVPFIREYERWTTEVPRPGVMPRLRADALRLSAGFFSDKVDRLIGQLRVMHYREAKAAPLPGQSRAGEHNDLSMITLLYSGRQPAGKNQIRGLG